MILRNDETRKPLAAKREVNSAQIEEETKREVKTRVS